MNKVIVRSAVLWALLAGVVAEVALVSPSSDVAAAADARARSCTIDDALPLPSYVASASSRAHLESLVQGRSVARVDGGKAVAPGSYDADGLDEALHLDEVPEFAGWHESRAADEPRARDVRTDGLYSLHTAMYVPSGPLGTWGVGGAGASNTTDSTGGGRPAPGDAPPGADSPAGHAPPAGGPRSNDSPSPTGHPPIIGSDPGTNGLIADLSGQPVDVGSDDYARTVAVTGTVPVPEPGTLALLAAGLAGLGFARRRRRA